MTLNLPAPVANYFIADELDGEAVARCFTDDAVVKDEGHVHNGHAAIKKWKQDTSAKFSYTIEPLACDEQNGKVVVTCHLTGNFPGSPVDLRFFFALAGEKIAALEVVP